MPFFVGVEVFKIENRKKRLLCGVLYDGQDTSDMIRIYC